MEISVIIPTFNEAKNIASLITAIKNIFKTLSPDYEIIVVDVGSGDNTSQIAKDMGVKVFKQQRPGYGGALADAILAAGGKYIITMDADFSHNPYIIKRLFSQRDTAHIVIASRYIRGGVANMPLLRVMLSVILNRFFCWALSLPLRDISSGFRLYRAEIFKEIDFSEKDFNVLVEILVKAYINGFTVKEVPFHYQPRQKGSSQAKIFTFGLGFMRTFFDMWKVRNTISSADYDLRAFNSRIPLQRFWQRQRYKIICSFVGYKRAILDIGCGTSKILGAFPQSIGMDINFRKLRFDSSLGNPLVNADIGNICFKDESFDVVICSEVIEHIRKDEKIFKELKRVLKKGGTLVLGTPDYSSYLWILIEWVYKKVIPGGYAKEHISHYTKKEIIQSLQDLGFKLEAYKYIVGSELICKFTKFS